MHPACLSALPKRMMLLQTTGLTDIRDRERERQGERERGQREGTEREKGYLRSIAKVSWRTEVAEEGCVWLACAYVVFCASHGRLHTVCMCLNICVSS